MIKNKVCNYLLIALILFTTLFLDPLKENFSTLSLTIKGYLWLLMLGIFSGFLLFNEIYDSKDKYLILFSFIIGTIIPYSLKEISLLGILHVFNAYLALFSIVVITIKNIYLHKKLINTYLICLSIAFACYFLSNSINTISEVIVIISTILVNYLRQYK